MATLDDCIIFLDLNRSNGKNILTGLIGFHKDKIEDFADQWEEEENSKINPLLYSKNNVQQALDAIEKDLLNIEKNIKNKGITDGKNKKSKK